MPLNTGWDPATRKEKVDNRTVFAGPDALDIAIYPVAGHNRLRQPLSPCSLQREYPKKPPKPLPTRVTTLENA
jgi:hypothetical protein